MDRKNTGLKKVLFACWFFVVVAYCYKDNFKQLESTPSITPFTIQEKSIDSQEQWVIKEITIDSAALAVNLKENN